MGGKKWVGGTMDSETVDGNSVSQDGAVRQRCVQGGGRTRCLLAAHTRRVPHSQPCPLPRSWAAHLDHGVVVRERVKVVVEHRLQSVKGRGPQPLTSGQCQRSACAGLA